MKVEEDGILVRSRKKEQISYFSADGVESQDVESRKKIALRPLSD